MHDDDKNSSMLFKSNTHKDWETIRQKDVTVCFASFIKQMLHTELMAIIFSIFPTSRLCEELNITFHKNGNQFERQINSYVVCSSRFPTLYALWMAMNVDRYIARSVKFSIWWLQRDRERERLKDPEQTTLGWCRSKMKFHYLRCLLFSTLASCVRACIRKRTA